MNPQSSSTTCLIITRWFRQVKFSNIFYLKMLLFFIQPQHVRAETPSRECHTTSRRASKWVYAASEMMHDRRAHSQTFDCSKRHCSWIIIYISLIIRVTCSIYITSSDKTNLIFPLELIILIVSCTTLHQCLQSTTMLYIIFLHINLIAAFKCKNIQSCQG